jgi:tetratricopeptide (TPR) repeat protein
VTADADHRAALHHAAVLLGSHRAAEAAVIVAPVLGDAPENVAAWLLMARIRLALDDDQGALDAAGRATALAPRSGYPLALAGLALSSSGRHDEAVAAGYQAVCCDPDDAHLHDTYARLVLCAGYHPADAERAARVAVALDRADPDHHVTLGVVLLAMGRRGRAREALRAALRLDPQDARARHHLAVLDAEGRNPLAVAGLADAARGFADALRTDPRGQANRVGLDLSLRTFLVRVTWVLVVLCLIAARLAAHQLTPAARLLAVAGVLVPVGLGWRFVSRLDPSLRRHVGSVVTARLQRMASVAAACTGVLMLAGAVGPTSWVTSLLIAAAICACVARLTTDLDTHRS